MSNRWGRSSTARSAQRTAHSAQRTVHSAQCTARTHTARSQTAHSTPQHSNSHEGRNAGQRTARIPQHTARTHTTRTHTTRTHTAHSTTQQQPPRSQLRTRKRPVSRTFPKPICSIVSFSISIGGLCLDRDVETSGARSPPSSSSSMEGSEAFFTMVEEGAPNVYSFSSLSTAARSRSGTFAGRLDGMEAPLRQFHDQYSCTALDGVYHGSPRPRGAMQDGTRVRADACRCVWCDRRCPSLLLRLLACLYT